MDFRSTGYYGGRADRGPAKFTEKALSEEEENNTS